MATSYCWRTVVGPHGSKVSAMERTPGRFYIRYWEQGAPGQRGKWRYKAIPVTARETEVARQEAVAKALELSRALLLAEEIVDDAAPLTLGALIARYTDEVSRHKKGHQPTEDARRAALWLAFLGEQTEVTAVTKLDLRRFIRARRAGTIKAKQWRTVRGERRLMPIQLTANPSDTTVGADIIYLQSVFNWAVDAELLERSKIARFKERPQTINPKQPIASLQRYQTLRAKALEINPLFAAFLDCAMGLGWRVSAICALTGADVNRERDTEKWPHGRIFKNPKWDKKGVGRWLPMPKAVREAVDRIAVVGAAPFFPSPKDPKKHWSRWHARDLLEQVEIAATLPHQDGGDFHPYRRLWATMRKHLPDADVMEAGGWRDHRSLKRSYQHVDDATLKSVMLLDPATPPPTTIPTDTHAQGHPMVGTSS